MKPPLTLCITMHVNQTTIRLIEGFNPHILYLVSCITQITCWNGA